MSTIVIDVEQHVGSPPRRRASGQSVRRKIRDTVAFYGDRRALRLLAVTTVLLTYGGGAVMFWFHALYRGEQGPAISDLSHWFLDSSLGFVALSPAVFLLLPVASRLVKRVDRPRYRQAALWALLVGAAFALITGPGPMLHNLIAGHGTPLADWATDVFGHDAHVAHRAMAAPVRSEVTESLLQVVVGLPVYVAISWLGLHLAVARGVLDTDRPRTSTVPFRNVATGATRPARNDAPERMPRDGRRVA